MKNLKTILFGLLFLANSCSGPDSVFVEKIKQQIKEDASGVELHYKNVEFQWTDTLFVKEKLSELNSEYSDRLNTVLNIEYVIKDNFVEGKVFSKSYLTKDRFSELRNWELKVGHPKEYSFGGQAGWVKDGYKDYYEFAFANRTASPWITELCTQIEEADSLLAIYDSLEEGNLDLIQNAVWFYNRIDSYESNSDPEEIWQIVSDEIDELRVLKTEIYSLASLNPEDVIYYKALNKYKINNPVLNGEEQEISKYFLFDSDLNIIGEEEYNE